MGPASVRRFRSVSTRRSASMGRNSSLTLFCYRLIP
jgi:hypothetical protein